jgi:Ankyrin repeats (3 copies)
MSSSDSKEELPDSISQILSALNEVIEHLVTHDNGEVFDEYSLDEADVSRFENLRQQCNSSEFQSLVNTESDSYSNTIAPAAVLRFKDSLSKLVLDGGVLVRVRKPDHSPSVSGRYSWSSDGFQLAARIVKAILSGSCNWCVDKDFMDRTDGGYDEYTSLMFAAENGHTSVVKLLLADSRVDKSLIDYYSQEYWTALMLASVAGHCAIVELFLADNRGSDSLNGMELWGMTALLCVQRKWGIQLWYHCSLLMLV